MFVLVFKLTPAREALRRISRLIGVFLDCALPVKVPLVLIFDNKASPEPV